MLLRDRKEQCCRVEVSGACRPEDKGPEGGSADRSAAVRGNARRLWFVNPAQSSGGWPARCRGFSSSRRQRRCFGRFALRIPQWSAGYKRGIFAVGSCQRCFGYRPGRKGSGWFRLPVASGECGSLNFCQSPASHRCTCPPVAFPGTNTDSGDRCGCPDHFSGC